MKQLNFLAATSLVILLVVQVFPSCDCQNVDCQRGYFSVQLLSKSDDSDLFENGTYQRDSLRLFVLRHSTAFDYSDQLYNWQNAQYSELPVAIDPGASGYIFQFNSLERDTLNITYTVSQGSECCPGEAVATYGLFKGDTILPNASGNLILKK